jgi:hypothetical protein
MPIAPSLADVKEYLGLAGSWTDEEIEAALTSETAAQARAVRFPADPVDAEGLPIPAPYPADLTEALCRRVAVNLANRPLPLGISQSVSEYGGSSARVGGYDREVKRLEAPWRRLVVA